MPESGFNSETQEFKIIDFNILYPEYILICTKEKTLFEIVPQKHFIIPAKLTDLNYSSLNSNKMNVDSFYSYTTKAFEQSQVQRNKIKTELLTQIDGFWNIKNNKQQLVTTIIETKRKFSDKIKTEIETLRKELALLQRHAEVLKQIKNIRCRSQ